MQYVKLRSWKAIFLNAQLVHSNTLNRRFVL